MTVPPPPPLPLGYRCGQLRGDVRERPFETGSFDAVYTAVYTMVTIERIDGYVAAIAEVRRVLRLA